MRIVIDLQGSQSQSRFRGIGRYSMSIAKAIARNAGEHEVIIALSDRFPETIMPIRDELKGLVPNDRIVVFSVPGPVDECNPYNLPRVRVAELIREHFLISLRPDVVLVTSLFEGFGDDFVSSIQSEYLKKITSVIVYDLIPLLKKDLFLTNSIVENWYMRKIDYLKEASLLLSISEYSRQEAIDVLKVDKNVIVNISTANSDHFLKCDNSNIVQLKEKYNIKSKYIMHNSAFEERKNFDGLLNAYALLPQIIKESYNLVLVGKKNDYSKEVLVPLVNKLGLSSNVIFTDYVDDKELLGLFSGCSLFVFPSFYEGFGLPALEAMACGAPTIGSNCTSIPEVIGREDALFDPNNVESIKNAIELALTDEDYRQSLIKHGLLQSQKFSWDESSKRAIAAFEEKFVVNTDEIYQEILKEGYRNLINKISGIVVSEKKLNDTDLLFFAQCIEQNERSARKIVYNKIFKDKLIWRIEGPFDSSYSLALLNRETSRALEQLGHTVVLHSTEGPGDFMPNELFLSKNPDLKEMNLRCECYPHESCDVVSRNLYPPRVIDMKGGINLLHNYAWEETALPQNWVELFNVSLQGLVLTSEHVKKIMLDNGISVPLTISGNGVDHWERIIPDSNYSVTGKAFKFLHVSSCFPRKGADVMLKAYGNAFTASDDVSLIIKTFKNPHNEIHKWLNEAKAAYASYPHVEIIEEELTDEELKALYKQCDALIAPSRAEGFGLPMAEAMLSGLPVITTGWSGQLDFCTDETSWLIDYKFDYAKTHFNLFDSVWAEPSADHLASLMRTVYELPVEKRMEKAKKGRELLLNDFKWVDVAERLVDSARSFSMQPDEPEMRIGWVTTWNTRCGIATYSEHLINELGSPVSAILAANTTDLIEEEKANVIRCWCADNNDTLNDLTHKIDTCNLNTIVIQFNLYFFNYNTFSDFIETQIKKGRIIIIVLHATFNPENDSSKKIGMLRESFLKCDRILVHSLKDLNRLKQLGLVDNVSLFPHGIIDVKPAEVKVNVPENRFVIGSYGFFLPNKGLLELIEAVSILVKSGVDAHLIMVNAEYPDPVSSEIINDGKKLIDSLELNERITLITDFLADEYSLGYLSKADLIVFPYQETGESASGAIRYGLASGKPVAVTPLPIFEDVAPAAHFLPGITPDKIADGIIDYIRKHNNGDPLIKDIAKRAEEWRESHMYSKIGKRLRGLLIALHRKTDDITFSINSNDCYVNLADAMKLLEDEIDFFIEEVERKINISLHDDAVREYFSTFVLKFPKNVKVPEDPYSKEYYDFQMQLYSLIAKNDKYSAVESEQSNFEIDNNRPFPYYTRSINTIGDQLLAIGYIIKTTDLKPNAKILEFGPGWGNTTVQLALSGFDVTAVEIGTNFCELLEYRKKQHGLGNLHIVNQDMVEFSNNYNLKDYDAVLFYESFHHCWDHDLLCKNLNSLINENGIVIFASEPILEKSDHFPYPWGVRIDGMSIWSTRKFGWLELGYEMNYFKEMLGKYDFKVEEMKSDVSPLTRLLIAKR